MTTKFPASGRLLPLIVVQTLTILVGLVRAKGLALVMGPAAFGVTSTIDQVVTSFVTLGAFAVPFTAMKFMARRHGQADGAFQRVGSGFLRLIVALGFGATLVASLIISWRPTTFGDDLASYAPAIRIALLGVPSAMLLIFAVSSFAAARRPTAAAVVNLLALAALTAAATIGAWWRGVLGLYYFATPVAIASSVTILIVLSRSLGVRFGSHRTLIIASLRREPEVVGYSLCFYATFAAGSVMMLLARTTVLSRLGEVAAGQLQAVLSIALTVGAVLYPLSNLYLGPLVNGQAPIPEKVRATDDLAGRMLVLLLLGASMVVLFPATLLRVLFSASFAPVAATLWVFVVWQVGFQVAFAYHQVLIGLDDVVFAAGAMIAGSVATIVLAGPATTRLGIAGAAAALALGVLLWGFLEQLRLHFRHRASVSGRVLLRLLIVLIVIAAAGSLFAGTHETTLSAMAVRLVVAGAIGCCGMALLDSRERRLKFWLDSLRPQSTADASQVASSSAASILQHDA